MKTKRALAVFLGIIFTLVFFEVVLRLIGFVDDQDRDTVIKVDRKKFKIFTLGNSYTAGSGAPLGESYPAQLQLLLNKKNLGKYAVINHGRHNVNTSFILEQLPEWLKENSPDLVFLMVGEANYWNKYNYWKFIQDYENSLKSNYNIGDYFRWSKLYRWIELIINNDSVFYSFSSANNSTIFKNVALDNQSRKLLGYLWMGVLERGFFMDRSSYIKLSSLKDFQLLEAENALLHIYAEDKNPLAARILYEIYIHREWRAKGIKTTNYIEKALFYLEEAIKHSPDFDITQWKALNKDEVKNNPKSFELKKMLISKMPEEEIIKLEKSISRDLPALNTKKEADCFKIYNFSKVYPSSITLTHLVLMCSLPIEMKWKAYENNFRLNPFTPLFDLPGEGYRLVAKNPEYKERLDKLIETLAFNDGTLSFYKDILDENLLKKWIQSDLNKMMALLNKTKTKIIIQTYPPLRNGEERTVDLVIRDWWEQSADKNKVILMDVNKQLKEIFIKNQGGDKFYSNERGSTDNHLNSQGYLEISKLMENYIP